MDGRGLRIGRVFGIDIVIDPSWIVIFFLITFSFWAELAFTFGRRTRGLWLAAIVGAALFFGSVLAHELSHSVVAVRKGIPVRQIRLFIFGGVSEIEQEAATPGDEFVIAFAGPASSFVIAGLLWLLHLAVGGGGLLDWILVRLAIINVALGVFNLLPGFPLDGGRVLRSVVWRTTGSYVRATKVAVAGGRTLAALLIAAGLYLVLFQENLAGLWWVAIGWFLNQAATASLAQLALTEALRGVYAGQLMTPLPVAVPAHITLDDLFDRFVMQFNHSAFPVTEGTRPVGLITLHDLRQVPRDAWPSTTVASAMRPVDPADLVLPSVPADRLLPRLSEPGRRVLVVDRNGDLVGIVSPSDVARWMQRSAWLEGLAGPADERR